MRNTEKDKRHSSRKTFLPYGTSDKFSSRRQERDFLLRTPEMEDSRKHFPDGFTVSRTIDGIPVSGNDFLRNCSVEDSDVLRILLAARRRAGEAGFYDAPGDGQITH